MSKCVGVSLFLLELTIVLLAVWLHEIKDTEQITAEQFCEGRKNRIAYNLFFSKFLPAIVGLELFRTSNQQNSIRSRPMYCKR